MLKGCTFRAGCSVIHFLNHAKALPYRMLRDFSIDPKLLHTLLQAGSTATILFLKESKGRRDKKKRIKNFG
jgi:hypothetical protein